VHVDNVLGADFENELPDRFQEWQSFDVSSRAPISVITDVRFAFGRDFADAVLDFVGHVRNGPWTSCEIIAAPFLRITLS